MRPAYRYAVYLVAVTLFSGCGATRSSRDDSFSPSGDAVSTSTEKRSASGHSKFPAPPPPAPPAYGVSHIKSIGFLRAFGGGHCDDNCGDAACADTCTDNCAEKCDDKCSDSCGLFRFGGKRRWGICCDKSEDCGSECTSDCAEGCDSHKKRGLFGCFQGRGCSLFGHSKCGSDCGESCGTANSCCNDECADRTCCAPDGCCNNACGDQGCLSESRQPCLSGTMQDPFVGQPAQPEPQSEAIPAPTPPSVPDAPEPVEAEPVDPTPPQAGFGWPFTKISSSRKTDTYFPSVQGVERHIVEPPMWKGRGSAAIASRNQMHAPEPQPQAQQYETSIIQPRLTVDQLR